jgi:predicted amidohydrolase YtcJ
VKQLCILFAAGLTLGAQPPADLILYNGNVWTVDPARPRAEAVAVQGSRIQKVGSNREVLALRAASTRTVDLQGKLLFPGFNDAHTHFENAVQWFFEVLVMDATRPQEILGKLQDAAVRVPEGMWITGTDWSALPAWTALKKKQPYTAFVPDLKAVDAVTPNHSVLLRRYDRVYFANSRALTAAKVTEQTTDPPGGHYERDANGKLTGVLQGTAGEMMQQLLPPINRVQKRIGALGVIQEFQRYGITSIQDIARVDAVSQEQRYSTFVERSYSDAAIFKDLRDRKQLGVRVYALTPLQSFRALASRGITPGSGDEWLRFGALKEIMDGSYMFEPWGTRPGYSGGWAFRFPGEEAMAGNILDADRAGFDIGAHVLGDRAMHLLLNWYEAAVKANGPRDRRFRLIHAWYATPADLERAGRMKLIADITPAQLTNDIHAVESFAGPARVNTAFAWKAMLRAGVKLDIVSDMPGLFNKQEVASFNPLENIYQAVTRNGWHTEQSLTVPEAIEAYTVNPAYASHEEKLKGSITEGKLADMVVISENILTVPVEKLRSTRVLYTILGGKFVYQP